MKKKPELEDDDEKELEILKAVAQAWYSHCGRSSSPTNEFDAHRRNFKCRPSRFKLDAMKKPPAHKQTTATTCSPNWDFGQSLWDSYEIVTVSKKLDAELVLDNPFPGNGFDDPVRVHRPRRESKNSLRNLSNRLSSRRFNEAEVPGDY